jgi:hypothetical protein
MEMLQRTEAPEGYFAGMLTGRGGFGVDSTGEPWLFFTALDHGVVGEALELWGGHVTQKRNGHGTSRFKYTARPERVAEILEDLLPHLRGYKRERADELLEYLSSP